MSFTPGRAMYQTPLSTFDLDVQLQPPESISERQVRPSKSASAAPTTSPQRNARSSQRRKHMLSCIECRQKKVKCDKADPCSRCVRVGTVCVPSPPSGAPRGRNGGRHKANHELLARITNLEKLVKGIKGRHSEEAPEVIVPTNAQRVVRYS